MKHVQDRTEICCFACGRKIGPREKLYDADTLDDQRVYVGASCMKKIQKAGVAGFQPEKGGPRLWTIDHAFEARMNAYMCGYTESHPKGEMPSRREVAMWAHERGIKDGKK